jgi:capsular polysaccharide biosynthesis protein
MLVTVANVMLNEILHDQIVDDHDVERRLGIPVLSVVPDIEEGME